MTDHLTVLRERAAYLEKRIQAKDSVGWESRWDERERAALLWAIGVIEIARLSSGVPGDA